MVEPGEDGRVLLLGDVPLVLAGLRAVLGGLVAGVVAGGADALLDVPVTAEVVVVAAAVWSDDHDRALAALRARAPRMGAVLVLSEPNAAAARRFLAGGGRAVLPLTAGVDAVRAAVRPAAAGGQTPAVGLSAREAAVLRRKAVGHTAKSIAADLGISAKTVETYYARALDKLGLRGRAAVVRHALGQGWMARP